MNEQNNELEMIPEPEENKEKLPEPQETTETQEIPEENTTPAETEPATPIEASATVDEIPEEKPIWSYAAQIEADKKAAKRRGARGALVYAIIMTCLFAVCFAILAVLLITGDNDKEDDGKDEVTDRPPVQITDSSNLPDLVDSVKDGVVTVYTDLGFGTGFVYTNDGYIITNFHQPKSTLLLLVSAYVGGDWHRIYDYALANGFRFLSYGDSSLLKVE